MEKDRQSKENTEIERTSEFVLMEAADNAQIVAEINGEMLKDMVYMVKGKSKLSYAGAKFAAIKLGNIHIRSSEVAFNEDLDQWEASALAYNGEMNITLPGYAEQPRLRKEKGELVLNEFARRTAVSKAVRNALMAVMPADHIAAYMKVAIEGGKGKQIGNKKTPPRKKVKAEVRAPTVGAPPRKKPPKKADPTPEEEAPTGTPESVDDVTKRIAHFLPGHNELVVISERGDYYRVGRKQMLDKEIENHLDFMISEMGGEWINDANEWRIPKKG